jgi:hypothetical protein
MTGAANRRLAGGINVTWAITLCDADAATATMNRNVVASRPEADLDCPRRPDHDAGEPRAAELAFRVAGR